jgi:branched-chain amino acid transport system permease protein
MRMPSMGLSFGSTSQVYYLTLAWVLACMALLYFFTFTPVGRLALGLRENGHRLAFLGYDVHRLGVLVFSISAMFSGVAGGLQVINNEAANYVVLDAHLSASVVLNTYIGGVKLFLGPALGASIMTFFGYAASDLTQSWLLYQGILFVLVMMFMPEGLAGLFGAAGRLRRRIGTARFVPVLLACMAAAALLAAGTAFTVELLQRMFSQDYRAMAGNNPSAPWPPIALFGRAWPPSAVLTWLVPALLLALGGSLVLGVRRWLSVLSAREEQDAAPGAAVTGTTGSTA